MTRPAVVLAVGEGHRHGNVEFLARSQDTPYFNLGIVTLQPDQGIERHVHVDEDDSFLVLEGTLSVTLGGDGPEPRTIAAGPGTFVLVPSGTAHEFRNDSGGEVRFLNVHAPGGFDRRIGLVG